MYNDSRSCSCMSYSTEPFELSHARINNGNPSHAINTGGPSQALSSPLSPAKPLNNNNITYSGQNGALAAAAFAGIGGQRPAKVSIEKKTLYHKLEMVPKVESLPNKRSPRKYTPRSIEKDDPKQPTRDRGQSPSYIAALVAASTPSPTYHASQAGSLLHPASHRPFALQNTPGEPLPMIQRPDETPIPATNSLVKLFESQTGTPHSSSKSSPPRERKTPPQSPDPPNIALTTGEDLSEFPRSKAAEGGSNRIVSLPNADAPTTATVADSFTGGLETSKRIISQRGSPPTPPPPRRTLQNRAIVKPQSNGRSSFANDSDGNSSASSYASALDVIHSPRSYRGLSPTLELDTNRAAKPSGRAERSLSANNLSSLHQQKSPGITKDFDRDDNAMARKRSLREGPLLSNSLTPQLTADSLANAMVASSLASSRAPSPSKPTPPLPRRHPKSHSLFNRSQSQEQVASRTPSPGRGMRQTMRESQKPDDDDEYKKRGGHLLNKHPNKHHEGDRKRWRNQLTEQERKRYEGVWAANKGLCMPSNDETSAAAVLDLVVRDIWRRSRLPDDVLEEIWDLVDGEKSGTLSREEFVVGLWLIDQRLKGRKLPVRVSESVWFSVRRLSGIKVSRNPH